MVACGSNPAFADRRSRTLERRGDIPDNGLVAYGNLASSLIALISNERRLAATFSLRKAIVSEPHHLPVRMASAVSFGWARGW